jgi:glutamate/tyrosine decarboxylase-like PLP-dependent enzyme
MPPLQVSPDQFRRLADRVTELATDFLASLDSRRTVSATAAGDTAAVFDQPAPEQGLGDAIIDDLSAIGGHVRAPTGRRFPYVIGSGEPIGALGDLYASVLNQNVTAWRSAPAAVTIERTAIRWVAEAMGCAGFVGSFTSGGSLANLMALAMARESRAPANEDGAQPCVVYASEEVHMSIPKAVALLGIGRASLRLIPVEQNLRIDVDALEAAIDADRRAGRRGIALVASAGTIMSGAIDPLARLAEITRANDLWFHVDGAYGALAALAQPAKFEGMELADSISLDAHKWLYQPLDCSILLYRNAELARRTFSYSAEYVKTASDDPIEGFAFFDQTLELSRRFRALKVWLSLRYHGLAAFREAIGENLRQAELFAELVEARTVARAARSGRAERGLLPLDGSGRRGAERPQRADPAESEPTRSGLALEREHPRRGRAPRLHHQPPHHRRGRPRGSRRGAGSRRTNCVTGRPALEAGSSTDRSRGWSRYGDAV